MKRRAAAFFDRDGVVNVTPGDGYVRCWDDFTFTEGIDEAIQICRNAGFTPVLITNQRGVFTGETADLDGIHTQMQAVLCEAGAQFEEIYAATGDRDDPRRKPLPVMIFEAASDLDLDLGASLMVGDNRSDILAANAAGLRAAVQLLGTKHPCAEADYRVANVTELCAVLRQLTDPADGFDNPNLLP